MWGRTQRRLPDIFAFAGTLLALGLGAPAAHAALTGAPVDWDSIINPEGPGSAQPVVFGVRIAGPSPYVRNPEESFAPASNAKLFTTGAALSKLGADFRFESRLEWNLPDSAHPERVSSLKLIGSGDPSWGMSEFGEDRRTRVRAIVAGLVAQGVTEVHGLVSVEAADARWDAPTYPPGWEAGDEVDCYGVLAQAFNLDLNCAKFTVTSRTKGHWDDAAIPVPVSLRLRAGSATRLKIAPTVGGFRITGTWASGSAPQAILLPINNAPGWVRNILLESLKEAGVKLLPDLAVGPAGDLRSLRFFSPPLAQILKPFLKNSMNVIGEALFKKLGELYGTTGAELLAAGREVLQAHVAGLEGGTPQAELWDGSGVSRVDSVTTEIVMAQLQDFLRRPDFSDVWDALPIAGVDGTLAERMRGTAADGVLRAKTGTLNGVYNLSGYVPRFGDSGVLEYVPFVILTRTSVLDEAVARGTEDRIGAALALLLNGQR